MAVVFDNTWFMGKDLPFGQPTSFIIGTTLVYNQIPKGM
jgi:hypothetical protein